MKYEKRLKHLMGAVDTAMKFREMCEGDVEKYKKYVALENCAIVEKYQEKIDIRDSRFEVLREFIDNIEVMIDLTAMIEAFSKTVKKGDALLAGGIKFTIEDYYKCYKGSKKEELKTALLKIFDYFSTILLLIDRETSMEISLQMIIMNEDVVYNIKGGIFDESYEVVIPKKKVSELVEMINDVRIECMEAFINGK